MSSNKQKIRDGLRKLTRNIISHRAEVVSISSDRCDVVLLENKDIKIHEVRLRSVLDNQEDGVIIRPTKGSYVIIGKIEDDSEYFVMSYSVIDSLSVKVGETTFHLEDGEITLNGGDNGGLININDLVSELNKTNQVVNAIVTALTTFIPVPSDGGAALKTMSTTQLTGKVVGNYSNIEDEKVKH